MDTLSNQTLVTNNQSPVTDDQWPVTADNSTLKNLQNKIFVILGLGREGISTYSFLNEHFPDAFIYLFDQKRFQDLTSEVRESINMRANSFFWDAYDSTALTALIKDNAVIFKSPGISPHSEFYNDVIALFNQPDLTSNANLFFELVKDQATIIGVTGTKGKSTTTSAIYHVLKNCLKQPVFLGGNIGVPPLDLISQIIIGNRSQVTGTNKKISHLPLMPGAKELVPVVVLELSSHQLLNINYSPHIAVIQDIVPEHLDYYQDFEEYVAAKARIVQAQTTDDLVIFNSLYTLPTQIAKTSKAQKVDSNSLISLQESVLRYQDEEIVDVSTLQIKGEHTVLNIIPAIIIAKQFDCSNLDIKSALQSFKPLKHRLELVATINDVEYYNDSLATTPEACIAALQAFTDKNIILIAGGYDRHLDFKELAAEIVKHKVKTLLLFKPTGTYIAEAIQEILNHNSQNIPLEVSSQKLEINFIETMQQAVEAAHFTARPGDVVLMSPASASFGRFKDYADRGEQFTQAVLTHK